jgi:Adenylate and Guanylate cyclase catalytic domain
LLLVTILGFTLCTFLTAFVHSAAEFTSMQFFARVFIAGQGMLAVVVIVEEFDASTRGCFFKILTDGVHRFEGTINQYTGDGIMALFGAPIAHEDHAARACYAALALQDDLRRYANELRLAREISFSVRMGLNSGEVVVGKIGDDLRMDYTALGYTASLGARMEQIAAPDRAYLTEHTAKLVEGPVQLEDLGKVTVKGAKEPLQVYELQGVGRLRTKLEVSRARGFSKFVGRHREMALLEDALERALQGNGQVVGIVADPGVGKSRLCFEFVERRCQRLTHWPASSPRICVAKWAQQRVRYYRISAPSDARPLSMSRNTPSSKTTSSSATSPSMICEDAWCPA